MTNAPNDPKVTCFKGAQEIADYIREDRKFITTLVLDENLPAFRRAGKGPWRALNVDLDHWMIEQRAKYINDRQNDAKDNLPKF